MSTRTGENRKDTQCQRVLSWLHEGKRLTQFEAIQDLGILRLASRIDELRQMGYQIETEMVEVENRWGEACRVASYTIKMLVKKSLTHETRCPS